MSNQTRDQSANSTLRLAHDTIVILRIAELLSCLTLTTASPCISSPLSALGSPPFCDTYGQQRNTNDRPEYMAGYKTKPARRQRRFVRRKRRPIWRTDSAMFAFHAAHPQRKPITLWKDAGFFDLFGNAATKKRKALARQG
jgi:hypothetical protein